MNNELSIRDMQMLELQIMKEIHAICQENDLTYYLGYGSCLGAVRHSGFIPWDDDMDIIMPYPDYIKFIEITKNRKNRYQLYSTESDPECIYPFAKFIDTNTELEEFQMDSKKIGIYIDIFPICGIPENEGRIDRKLKKLKYLDYLVSVARKRKPVGKNIITSFAQIIMWPVAKIIGTRRINRLMIEEARKEKYESSRFVAVLPPAYGKKEVMKKEVFAKKKLISFETEEFFIMESYDEYLRGIYNDYMKLPPEDKRSPKHPFTVKFIK